MAAALWLDSRSFRAAPGSISARYIRESTEKSYQAYVNSLNLFFASLPLERIHLGHLRQYQEARVSGAAPFIRFRRPQDAKPHKLADGSEIPAKGPTPCPASPKKANQELCILKMIMRRAGCWQGELDEFFEPFAEDEPEVPRALTPEEQQRWLDVAAYNSRWAVVFWYSVLAFETSMSTNEMRSLRIGDVNLAHRLVCVPAAGAKNRYRQRTIPIVSGQGLWAVEQLLCRAGDLGAKEPQHYLFPFRKPPADYIPARPMTLSGIKRGWEDVRHASGLTWFRPYDTRHTAITRWAEAGVAPEIIRARAGHVSPRMMLHYTHISEAAQRRALESAPGFGPQPERAPFYVRRRA